MSSRRDGLVIILAFLASSPALGDGLRDVQDSWLVDAVDMARLLRGPGASETGGWSVEAMQGRLYGLAELPQHGLRGQWRSHGKGGLAVGLARQQMGTELFRTTGLEGRVRWGTNRGAGLVCRVRQADSVAGGWPAWWRLSASLHGVWALGAGRAEGQVFLPLSGVPAGAIPEGREAFCRGAWWSGPWVVVWQVDRDPQGRPCCGWSLDLALGQGAGVGLRADGTSGVFGMGVMLLRGVFLLRTSHLAHPRLGLTHRFSVGVVRP
ncbi:hypothetical protein CSB20_06890 [bacterium DOLZORAL124_64_63]|nr:MAG: hypothetical protein CSB20_06890 [bacterium DOLZORAL124_64_63]